PGVLEHTLDQKTQAHPQAQIAAELVDEALRLRADTRKRKQRRGPGRFSEARAREREARQLLAEARELEDRAELSVLEKAQVVLATLTGVESRALEGRRFAIAVVDEATQAVEPAAYLALLRADRVVLAGDHLQLPLTVLAPDAQQLALSLFERLARAQPGAMVTPLEQHRMNEGEELEIDTVDGFQGREKEAVVVSLVRSNPAGELGFVADIRRINVALTRARKKLIVVGDSATIARHPFHEGLVKYAERIGAWRSAWDR